jgi:hypothetical protein
MKTKEELMFSEDEIKFRQELVELVERDIAPEFDKIYEEDIFPRDLYAKVGEHGFLGQVLPPQYGGRGKLIYDAIVAEELGAYNPPVGFIHAVSSYPYATIYRHGNEEQKRNYLPPMVQGEKIGAIVITEDELGSDVMMMQTRARREGDEYVINGEKRNVTEGSEADVLIVWAITNPDVDPAKGMTAFLVEPTMPGFEVVERHKIMGNIPGLINSRLRFNDLRVPAENVLGKLDRGFPVMMDELAIERSLFGALLVGFARPLLDLAVKYSYERKQFGVPIRQFEAISFRIADMATKLEAMRLLVYHVIRMLDEGLPAEKISAMAKVYPSEVCYEIAHDALQITGSKGVSADKGFYIVEYLFRMVRMCMIPTGTNEIQKYIIQREIYKEYKQKLKSKPQNKG